MEIYKTKISGCDVSVIFTGKNYFFHNSYYGWVCVAERKEGSLRRIGTDDPHQDFTLLVGNHHTVGGRMNDNAVISAAKRFITKNEQRYVCVECNYDTEEKDLSYCIVNVAYEFRA